MITAKVKCTGKQQLDESDADSQVTLEFQPDYSNGRNKEWAKYTPALSLTMTVKADVAGHFDLNEPYMLQFVRDED